MNFAEYQQKAQATAVYPGKGENLFYPTIGLAGEVCEKIKKIMRDKAGKISSTDRLDIAKELGDVLWYVTDMATELGFPMEAIAALNIKKLSSRDSRGKIGGNGDDR